MQDKIKTDFGISINDDCLNVIKNMPSNYVDMIVTDPPYGINYQSNGRKNKMRRILNDDCDFRFSVYRELKRVMKENSVACFFCSWKNFADDYNCLKEIFNVINVLIWYKGGGGIGNLNALSTDYEMCIVCEKGSTKIRGKRCGSVIRINKVPPEQMKHPTEKPIDLYRFVIRKWSDRKNIVLDCFAGSFVNAIACIEEDRKYICIEQDEEYFKQGTKRIESKLLQIGKI